MVERTANVDFNAILTTCREGGDLPCGKNKNNNERNPEMDDSKKQRHVSDLVAIMVDAFQKSLQLAINMVVKDKPSPGGNAAPSGEDGGEASRKEV